MSAFGWTRNKGNILTAGFSDWKVKAGADVAYYKLGRLGDTKVTIDAKTDPDSVGRNLPHAAVLEASARLFYVNKTNLLNLLVNFGTKDVQDILVLHNGQTISSENLATDYFGHKYRFVCDQKLGGGFQYVELVADRGLTKNDVAALYTAPPADGVATVSDVFYTMKDLVYADKAPAGFSKVEFKPTADAAYADNFGVIRNAKLIIEGVTDGEPDSEGRSNMHGDKVTVEFDAEQSGSTETGLLDDLMNSEVDYKITLASGMIATFDDKLGIAWRFENAGTPEKKQFIHVNAEGYIKLSELATVLT